MFELPPKGGLLFSEVVGWSATSSPGGILLLTISLLLYSSLTLCYSPSPSLLVSVCVSERLTCVGAHTYTNLQTLAQPPHLAFLTFDHLSVDVYGPLFAVLMIIVTG